MAEPLVFPVKRVLAQAIVDELEPGRWEVTVWGLPPFEERRVYTIEAADDNAAAFEGINSFVKEMQTFGQ